MTHHSPTGFYKQIEVLKAAACNCLQKASACGKANDHATGRVWAEHALEHLREANRLYRTTQPQ